MLVRAPVAHDAHRLQREQHGEALPNLTIPAGITQFLLHDGVGLAEDIQPLTGHFADHADGEAGTGERLTPDDGFGHTEFRAHLTHFILEQFTQRLDELHVHLFRQAAHVVVALDDRARPLVGHGLDHVGIEGPLSQPFHVADGARLFIEDVDEGMADDLALLLRVFDPGEQIEETILRVHQLEVQIEVLAQVGDDLVAFAGAEHAVIHKDAVQVLADGLVQQHGDHGGVHTAGERADHMPVAHGFAHFVDHALHKGRHGPVRGDLGDLEQKVAEHGVAVHGVVHFGVELHGVDLAGLVGHGCR